MADFGTKTGIAGTPIANVYDSTPALTDRVPITGGRETAIQDIVDTAIALMDVDTGAMTEVLGRTVTNVRTVRTLAEFATDMAADDDAMDTIHAEMQAREVEAPIELTATDVDYYQVIDNLGVASLVTPAISMDAMLAATGVPAAIGATATVTNGGNGRTIESWYGDGVDVLDYGADRTGATDSTAAFAAAIAAVPAGGVLRIPRGTYSGWLVIHRSDIKVEGAGSSCTTIKLPDDAEYTVPDEPGTGTITGVPSCVEVGQLSRGNNAAAYSNVHVSGLTLDGNKANTTEPTLDLFGWGLAFTRTSQIRVHDVRAISCHAGGFGAFIESDYGDIDVYTEDCGFALGHPGFDINSSDHLHCRIVTKDCNYGARILDNCFGNTVIANCYNSTVVGFIYNNQSVNESRCNTIIANIHEGCASAGIQIGIKCYDSNIIVNTHNLTGFGIHEVGVDDGALLATVSKGNNYTVTTRKSGLSGVKINSNANNWNIASSADGDSGASGDFFAIYVNGENNLISAVVDGNSFVRGIYLSASSGNNELTSVISDVVEAVNDAGNGNKITQTTWTNATLAGGWSSTFGDPYAQPGYIKDKTTVRLRGSLTGGTGTAFTLPAAYRPAKNMLFPTIADGATGKLQILANGEVSLIIGTATAVELGAITFSIL